MSKPKWYSAVFELGEMAYRIGLSHSDCPFGKALTPMVKVWIKGFNSAKIKHKRDKKNVEDIHGTGNS